MKLTGLRVVDLSQFLPGPYLTLATRFQIELP
jgi:crotonobetainyl-CoA:carnitine CoA-transferase CaiB-like acyl-CoA transferase